MTAEGNKKTERREKAVEQECGIAVTETPVLFSKQQYELHQQPELHQHQGRKEHSPGALELNPEKELPVLLVCLI